MELELGLAPPNNTRHLAEHLDGDHEMISGAAGCGGSACGKRGFSEAFEEEKKAAAATTLPLFDDGSRDCRKKKRPVVGWPPVSSARRACGGGGGGGGANHVKVKKEGVAIGRKVDLSRHASYDDLLATLTRMFPNASYDEEFGSDRDHGCARRVVVTYEDADGDWMLVGDVPWDDFAKSVKRLKILL